MLRVRKRNAGVAVVAMAVVASVVTVDALSLDGLKALFTRAEPNTTLFAYSSKKATQLMTCVWTGSFDSHNRADEANAVANAVANAPELSAILDGEDSVRTYPTFPHAPVLVAASSCQSVVLRWKSFDDATWPVTKYILQRHPDTKHRNAWTTLLETDSTTPAAPLLETYPDTHVRPGKLYSYRVQAISTNNVSSAYAFHQVAVSPSNCNGVFFGLLPSQFPSWNMFTNWSCEAVRTLCLIVLCFITVYGLMRASVTRMQGTRSRSYRLKRIHKSTAEGSTKTTTTSIGGGVMQPPKLTQRSSSESSSTTSPSEPMDQISQRSMESMSVGTRDSFAVSSSIEYSQRESSFSALGVAGAARDRSASLEKASACQNCQKRFGIFRRRHMCDICQAVTLCRKCGYQAPVNFTRGTSASIAVGGMEDSYVDDRRSSIGAGTGRESFLGEGQRKVKIKTICRGCCEEVYRYSTSVRPSNFGPTPVEE